MPVLTLAEVASLATRFAHDAVTPLSVVSEYANLAYNHVALAAGVQHAPTEVVAFASTTTSDNRLAYPTDYDRALGLKLGVPGSWSTATSRTTSWEPLAKEPAPWGDPYQSDTSGEPERYAEFATWLELRPSPDSAYSVELRYQRKLSALTTSTATFALDEQWHWALALKTAELLAAASGNTLDEAANRGRFGTYVRDLRTDQAKRLHDGRGAHVAYVRRLH